MNDPLPMSSPWLSLVTITKDDSSGLGVTLASAAALREAGAEHIVIDGSATERASGSSEITDQAYDGVRVLARAPRGISDALNAGLAEATGEWIWFLNGGDAVDPQIETNFLARLLTETRAEVVIGGTTYLGEVAPRPHPPANLRWPPFRSWIPHPSTLVRRRMFDRHGGFDESYTIAMDYEWWLRAIPDGAGVDVVSLPFAVFAAGGVSQRPESLPILAREHRRALRRHRAVLTGRWWGASARLWRAWARSWLPESAGRSEGRRDD